MGSASEDDGLQTARSSKRFLKERIGRINLGYQFKKRYSDIL